MRVGLYLAYWPWFSPEEQVAPARQAYEAGLDSGWPTVEALAATVAGRA